MNSTPETSAQHHTAAAALLLQRLRDTEHEVETRQQQIMAEAEARVEAMRKDFLPGDSARFAQEEARILEAAEARVKVMWERYENAQDLLEDNLPPGAADSLSRARARDAQHMSGDMAPELMSEPDSFSEDSDFQPTSDTSCASSPYSTSSFETSEDDLLVEAPDDDFVQAPDNDSSQASEVEP